MLFTRLKAMHDKKMRSRVPPEEVVKLRQSGAGVVDVRSSPEARPVLAPGATNTPPLALKRRMAGLPHDKDVVLYRGTRASAGKAGAMQDAQGFKAINGGSCPAVLKIVGTMGRAEPSLGQQMMEAKLPTHEPSVKTSHWMSGAAIALAMFAAAAQAQAVTAQGAVQAGMAQELPPAQIFTLLFLMLGPFKIIGPFTQLTKGVDDRQAHRIAALSAVFASAALLVAAFLGRSILDSYRIPVPVMALSGGLILLLVALKNLLQQFQLDVVADRPAAPAPGIREAMMPLAFPTIVTPYGIAAVVVLMALTVDTQARLLVGGIIVAIMLVNLVIMMLARKIMPVMGIVLPILGAVLGVVQVALGLRIIHNALTTMGVL
jgi:multiple antibiotic resistance protein